MDEYRIVTVFTEQYEEEGRYEEYFSSFAAACSRRLVLRSDYPCGTHTIERRVPASESGNPSTLWREMD